MLEVLYKSTTARFASVITPLPARPLDTVRLPSEVTEIVPVFDSMFGVVSLIVSFPLALTPTDPVLLKPWSIVTWSVFAANNVPALSKTEEMKYRVALEPVAVIRPLLITLIPPIWPDAPDSDLLSVIVGAKTIDRDAEPVRYSLLYASMLIVISDSGVELRTFTM